jgi:16S rRNA (cytosine967-C5)-methyltransferase
VYSTCSIEAEENMAQVDWFLKTRSDFVLDAPVAGSISPSVLNSRQCLCCLPMRHATDGAFAARFRRVS